MLAKATMLADAVRNTSGPNLIAVAPAYCKRASSSAPMPPSGPTSR